VKSFARYSVLVCSISLGCGSAARRDAAAAHTKPADKQPLVAASAQATQTSAATPAARPPSFTFVAPQAWRSRKPGVAPIEAPDLAQETWRALVTQSQPLQKKTPHWQALPAAQTVELQMQEASAFRCVVSPAEIRPDANTWGNKLKAWEISRSMLCSSDGWHSWTEAIHHVRRPVGAERPPEASTGLLLREQESDGSVRQSFVVIRSDKEQREATTGPPRVLPGVAVDDD
jgi:hypothetical protein